MYVPSFSPDEFRSPTHHFRISTGEKKIAYCYIRKNACTAFKYFLSRRPTLSIRLKKVLGFKRYNDPDHFVNIRPFLIQKNDYAKGDYRETIFVYRDPVDRTVSTYLNKFVDNSGAEVIRGNYERVMARDPEDATFMDFLQYASHDFSEIDCHLWPQKAHLWDVTYTRAINIKAVHEEMVDLIGAQLAERFFSKRSNATDSNGRSMSEPLVDIPASRLRDMKQRGITFGKVCFLSRQVEEIIGQRYRSDYEMMQAIEHSRLG